MDFVYLGNGINLIGVALLLISHTIISLKDDRRAFLFGFFGGCFIATGSYLLESYPVLILNIFWSLFSLLGYFEIRWNKKKFDFKHVNILIALISVFLFFVMDKTWDNLAFITTFIYLTSYLLFSLSLIKKVDYLMWCTLGFLMLFPHLIDKIQVSVSINEIYGFIIGIVGIRKELLKENRFFKKRA